MHFHGGRMTKFGRRERNRGEKKNGNNIYSLIGEKLERVI
jgi:hypothetical protein